MTSHSFTLTRETQKSTDPTPPNVTLDKASLVNKENLIDNYIVPHSSQECVGNPDKTFDYKPLATFMDSERVAKIKHEWEIEKGLGEFIWKYAQILSDSAPLQGDLGITTINDFLGFNTLSKWSKRNWLAIAFTNEDGSPWQVKPYPGDQEKQGENQKKTPKYLGAKGAGDKAYTPEIPDQIIEKICSDHSVNPPAANQLSWDWLKKLPKEVKENITIIITEGAAKCLAAMKQGYLAISLFGCQCYPDELQKLLRGFKVTVAFDSDTKETAKLAVQRGIYALHNGRKHSGKKGLNGVVKSFSVATWQPELGKGLDDLILNNPLKFPSIIEGALPFKDWKKAAPLKRRKVKGFDSAIELADEYIGDNPEIDFDTTSGQQILSLALGKGRGKTKRIAAIVQGLKARGEKVLVLGHRITLGLQNAALFQVKYKGQNSGGNAGYACCFDSLLESSGFYLEDYTGSYLILDEATQGIAHLLLSRTLKENRTEIVENFVSLVKNCKGVLLADADLCQSDIDFVASLFDNPPSQKTFTDGFTSTQKTPFILYEKNALVVSHLDSLLKENKGARYLIHTDSVAGKFGTQVLTEKYQKLGLKVLQLDSVTFNLEGHPANKLKQFLELPGNTIADYMAFYDIVIVSPAVGTGWSIEPRNSELFGGVFILGNGVADLNSLCQSFMRYRSKVPRYASIPKMGMNYFGGRETVPNQLKKHIEQRGKVAASQLLSLIEKKSEDPLLNQWHRELSEERILSDLKDLFFGDTLGGEGAVCQAIFNHALDIMCTHNIQQFSLRESVLEVLEKERCWEVTEVEQEDSDSATIEAISRKLGGIKSEKIDLLVSQLADENLPILSTEDFSRLESKSPRTEKDNLQLRKTSISRKYPLLQKLPEDKRKNLIRMDVTKRGLYQALRTRYYLQEGREFLPYSDLKKYLAATKGGKKPMVIDLVDSQYIPRVLALELCKVNQFLVQGAEFSQAALTEWYRELLDYRKSIKGVLGISMVNELSQMAWERKNKKSNLSDSQGELDSKIHKPIQFANKLLSLIGLKLRCMGRRRTPEGLLVRPYCLDDVNPLEWLVIEDWYDRDLLTKHLAIAELESHQPPELGESEAIQAFFGTTKKEELTVAESLMVTGIEAVPTQEFNLKQTTSVLEQPTTHTGQGFDWLQGAKNEFIPYIGSEGEYPPDLEENYGGFMMPIEATDPDDSDWAEYQYETEPDDLDTDWGDYGRDD